MRLGCIGDVHAEDEHLRTALDALAAGGVDRILCTGDLADGFGDLDRTCALLRARDVLVVRGNHDRWLQDDQWRALQHAHLLAELAPATVAYLRSLPPTLTLDTPLGALLLCHGVGPDDRLRLTPDDGDDAAACHDALAPLLGDRALAVMVGGHTHVPMVRRFERDA